MAKFWLDQFIRVELDAMHNCSVAYSQLGPANIEYNNGDDDVDDGQVDDHDFDCMAININYGYGNDFELDRLQDVDISKGVDRGGDNGNDDKIDVNGDIHIDLEGPLGS